MLEIVLSIPFSMHQILFKLNRMGNELGQGGLFKNPFSQPGVSSQTAEVLSQFNFKSRYDDSYFGQVCLLQHKSTHQFIILKEITYESSQTMQINYKEFLKRKERLTCDNIIRLRYVIKKTETGFLSEEHKVILFFDYILIDLRTQMENRKKQGKVFSSEEIGSIIAGSINGYAFLEEQGIPNNKIRLGNMYFGTSEEQPIVKVADPNLFPSVSNVETVMKREKGYEEVFLAPEQLQNLENAKSTNKSHLFTLGICLLQLCLLQPSSTIYNYRDRLINMRDVDERLNIVKNKYPLGIYYILKEMLEKSHQHRMSFSELEKKMPTNIKNSPQEAISLTVANKFQKKDHVAPLIPKPKVQSNPAPSTSDPYVISNTKIVPSIVPPQVRQTTSLTSQYRPQVSANLQQVNEVYTNGNSYKGQKNVQNQRHGKGKYIYADGSYYYGDWTKNKMSGNGVLYYPDGQVEYDGEWKQDNFQGRGTLYGRGCDWNKYDGQFHNGEMEGFGTMSFNDGNVFIGSFRNDKPLGKGKMQFRQGGEKSGFWEGGNFIKE